MNFLEMVIRLQITYDEKIILISCGAFYIAVGSDAVVLNKELGLKTTCAKTKICKVGVPKSSIDKYKEKLNELGYSYIILDYDKDKRELIKIFEVKGQKKKIVDINKGCSICEIGKNRTMSEYDEALKKYYETEFGEAGIW